MFPPPRKGGSSEANKSVFKSRVERNRNKTKELVHKVSNEYFKSMEDLKVQRTLHDEEEECALTEESSMSKRYSKDDIAQMFISNRITEDDLTVKNDEHCVGIFPVSSQTLFPPRSPGMFSVYGQCLKNFSTTHC